MSRFQLPFFTRNGHVTLDECYLLTRQLYVLQKAGVPLLSSLQALQSQLPVGALKKILGAVHQDLLEGRTFSQALARQPGVFSPVFLGLIRVGEAGGLLEEALQQLTQLTEWEMVLRNRLREALQYPLIVLTTLSIALILMVTFVLPRFAKLFQAFRVPLPLQTRLLMAVSQFLLHYGWFVAILIISLLVGFWRYVRTERGRFRWDRWMLCLPILGPMWDLVHVFKHTGG